MAKDDEKDTAPTEEKKKVPIFARMRRTKRTEEAMEREEAESKKLALKRKKVVKKTKILRKPRAKARDIGVDVVPPESSCNDPHCPFHGTLPVRGQIIKGVVVSAKMHRSAVVAREYPYYIRKYERYEKRTRRYIVHNPDCIHAVEGDPVTIMECRPISKNKAFVIIEKGE